MLLSESRYGNEQNAAQGHGPMLSPSGTQAYCSGSVFHCAIKGPRENGIAHNLYVACLLHGSIERTRAGNETESVIRLPQRGDARLRLTTRNCLHAEKQSNTDR